MLRKNLSFLASLFAVILLLGMQKPVKAEDNLYTYTISGSGSATVYAQCYAAMYGGSPYGYLSFYQNGSSYSGYIKGVTFSTTLGVTTSKVTSYGFLNGVWVWNATYTCVQDGSGHISVAASVDGGMGSSMAPANWGYAYMW